MATAAAPTAELTSIDRDASRTEAARSVLAGLESPRPRIQLLTGDWSDLVRYGPFDLLFLDGGGQGKDGRPPIALRDWLRPGGVVVLDDFTAFTDWPPTFEGKVDEPRLHWLRHPELLSCEIPIGAGMAAIVGRYLGNA